MAAGHVRYHTPDFLWIESEIVMVSAAGKKCPYHPCLKIFIEVLLEAERAGRLDPRAPVHRHREFPVQTSRSIAVAHCSLTKIARLLLFQTR